LVHCFAIPRYRSSLSLVLIHWFFTKLWPLDLKKNHKLSVFRTFFCSAYRYSFDTWYIGFAIPRYRLSLSLAFIHWFFTKLWPLDLEKNHKLSVFRTFFSLCLHLFIWYLVHCISIPRYRLSLSLVLIHWFFTKKSQIISFPDFFFSLLTDIHLIFGTLLFHTKIHIKFEYRFFSRSYGPWT
jgi:hypothetical protein